MTAAQLAPVPASAAEARHFVDVTLRDWRCDKIVDDARLIVTELVSNVVRHGETTEPMILTIELHRGVLRISLEDGGADGNIEVVSTDLTSESGRGLRLVEGLSDVWGVDRHDDHKVVWAEFHVPT